MSELSKSDYRTAKEVLRVGILRLHENWQKELAKLLARPFVEGKENAYDRSMEITKMARDWFKEANSMENWYSKDFIVLYISMLYRQGTLSETDIASLSDEIKDEIRRQRHWD